MAPHTEIGNNDDDDDGDNDADQFTTYYENSEDYKRIHDEVYAIIKSNVSTTDTEKQNLVSAIASRMNSGTTVGGLYALRTLVWFRGLKDLKDPTYIAPRLGDKVIFGFIVMSLFWGVGNDFYGNGIQSTVSVLFMICALNGFGAASYVPTLVLQRPLFYRERNDGLYGEATYLTFIFGMEAVLATVTCSVYTVIVYWAIHFHINFALLWVVYYVSALIGISAAFFFAAVSPNLQVANALLPIYMVLNLFFAGLFIPFDNLPSYWQWYSYIDFMRWAWGSLTVGQYSERNPVYIGDKTVLEFFDLRPNSEWELFGYLSIFVPVYIGLTYLGIRFVNHSKR